MKRKVKEAFHYAADGIRPNLLKVGRSYEFADDHAARFEAEGKLEPLAASKPASAKPRGKRKAK